MFSTFERVHIFWYRIVVTVIYIWLLGREGSVINLMKNPPYKENRDVCFCMCDCLCIFIYVWFLWKRNRERREKKILPLVDWKIHIIGYREIEWKQANKGSVYVINHISFRCTRENYSGESIRLWYCHVDGTIKRNKRRKGIFIYILYMFLYRYYFTFSSTINYNIFIILLTRNYVINY